MNVNDAQVAARVVDLVADTLDIDPCRLGYGARLGEDLCIDSLAATELALVIEDDFSITLPDEMRAEARTVGDVVQLVVARLGAEGLDDRAG